MNLYKKPAQVPMSYGDLMRLIAWIRDLVAKGVELETARIMIAFVDKLELIGKEMRIKDDEEIQRQLDENKKE